jgi:branched-chain amino acid transport system substrate-binding protein
MHLFTRVIVALISCLLISVRIFAQVPDPETVILIQLEPLSGPFQEVGELSVAGVQFAIEEINAAGGLLGKRIAYRAEDSELKPDTAARKATQAILEDHAQLILQLNSAAVARALMNVAQKNKVLFVTLGAEADSLTGKDFNSYFFRTCLTTHNRSRAYAEFFKTKPWRKFYLINMNYPLGQGLAENFKATMKKEIPGLKIVGEDFYSPGVKDFSPHIHRILAADAEIIFTGSWGVDLETLLKQGAEMGVKARYATYFLDDPFRLASIGPAAVGSFVISSYLPMVDTPQNQAFLERWNKKYKGTKTPWPTSHIGGGYDGARFLFAAIKKAQSFKPEAISLAWEGMEFNGLLGRQMMRACDHQVLMPAAIGEVQSKSNFFPFPFPGTPTIVPLDKVAVSYKETGNSRCK